MHVRHCHISLVVFQNEISIRLLPFPPTQICIATGSIDVFTYQPPKLTADDLTWMACNSATHNKHFPALVIQFGDSEIDTCQVLSKDRGPVCLFVSIMCWCYYSQKDV